MKEHREIRTGRWEGIFAPPRDEGRQGYILLAVIVFIALLLPIVTLVLSTVGQETIAANNLIVETKTRMAADAAVNSAISVLVEREQMPDYFVSNLPEHIRRAIIVDDNGVLRWNIDNDGAGLDGIYGTGDDWYIGPHGDRKMMGPSVAYPEYDPDEPRNYKIDFRYVNWHKPTYLAENWAWSPTNPFAFNRASGRPVYLYNQFAAIYDDGTGSGLMYAEDWEGYHPDDFAIFPPDRWVMPGYYPGASPPPSTDISGTVGDIDGAGDKGRLARSNIALYQPKVSNFGTTDDLKNEVAVTDEAGRLNLNIFCKKMPVWASENSAIDFDLDGEFTLDFNYNEVEGELIWKWIDNPLFPDRDSVIAIGDGTGNGTDFNGNEQNEPWLGEDLQHYYAPDWVDYADRSIAMLTALPGIDVELAKNILRALNPDLSTLPSGYNPDPSGVTPNPPVDRRADVPNLSPNFYAYYIDFNAFGQITGVRLLYENDAADPSYSDYDLDWDDIPLPRPRPFTDIKQLLDINGMTKQKYGRLQDYVTVFSYDTNVISTEIWDSEPSSGDDNDINDVRYNINNVVSPATLASYRSEADRMWGWLQNHMTETRFKKFTLPILDRMGNTRSDVNPGDPDTNFQDPDHTPYHLNPEFGYESLLSIILYRNGYQAEDAYSYDPIDQSGTDIRSVEPGIPFARFFGIFFGGFSNSFIPIPEFQPSYVADPSAGRNINAQIPPHNFTSVADLLEVPLYKFDNLAISAMTDTPSAAVCNNGDEIAVQYLVSFSDVITNDEYDSVSGEILPTYTLIFDWDSDGFIEADDYELTIDMTDGVPDNDLLSLRTPPPTPSRPSIIGTFDQPLYNQLQLDYPGEPWNWRANNFIAFNHTFRYNAGLGNIPDPDPARAGQSVDFDGDGRSDFAFDAFGDPFITARVSVIKNMTPPGGPDDYSALRADTTIKVYLQHNCEAIIPLKTNILAIRTGNNTYQVLSRSAGGNVASGPVYLYNWNYSGFPHDDIVDGIVTNPADWSNQTIAPSITLEPSPGGSTSIGLEVYDIWGADPAAVSFWAGAGGFPYDLIDSFLTSGDPAYGNAGSLAPINGENVDLYFGPPPEPPAMWDRLLPSQNYDRDVAEVYPLSFSGDLYIELAAEQPSLYQGQYSVLHAAAYGGSGPYRFVITINGPGGYFDSFDSGFIGSNTYNIETEELTGGGVYNVQLTVTDSSTPAPLVKSLPAPETIQVGSSSIDTELYINVPNLTVSAKVMPYESDNPANTRSFLGVASVSGGRSNYLIRWDVRREDGSIVNQNYGDPPGINPTGQMMTYTHQGEAAVFTFDPTNTSDGLYFVYCNVIDSAGINPNLADSTLATDIVPILLSSSSALDPEPRVLPSIYASPPGNDYSGTRRASVPGSATLGGPPQIGTFSFATPHNSIEPRIAPPGSIIEIRGVNFNTIPSNNRVAFEPGMSTSPFSVQTEIVGGPGSPDLQVMRVVVPEGARSGFVVITDITTGGASQAANRDSFFNTNWEVSFDLYAIHKDTYSEGIEQTYRYDVDFQGDGVFDWSIQTSNLEILAENHAGLTHDYSRDGVGNYQATVMVTNVISQKVGVSHQLVQMRDLVDYALTEESQVEATGLSVNILPDFRRRQPLPNEALTIKSFADGVTNSLGLGYKWNLDSNSRVSAFMARDIVQTLPFFTSTPTFITSDVIVESFIDAKWATTDTPVDVVIKVKYPFSLNEPAEPGLFFDVGSECSTFIVNMADGGAPITVRGVVVETGPNYSIEEARFTYSFTNTDGAGESHRPTFTALTGWGEIMPGPITGSVFPMPRIRISNYLTNLTLDPTTMHQGFIYTITDVMKQIPNDPPYMQDPTFCISGNHVNEFPPGREFYVIEAAGGNDGTYHVLSSSYNAGTGNTEIIIVEKIQSAVVSGKIIYYITDEIVANIYDGRQHYLGLSVVYERLISGETSWVEATDSIILPIVQRSSNNVHSYLAFDESYSLSHGTGAVEFNMLGILGVSSTLDYKSDINSDGRVDIGGAVYPNPHTLSIPLRNTLNPLTTWPTSQPMYGWHDQIPGVPQYMIGQVPVPYVADRGIYNSWALVTETLGGTITPRTRNIAVDTQEIMVGGRRSSTGIVTQPPFAVDAFVDPLLGTASQTYILQSFVSGGDEPYTYLWEVFYNNGGTWEQIFLNEGQENMAQSYFTPDFDAMDEFTGGTIPQIEGEYRIDLTVADSSGVNIPITDTQYIRILDLELYAQLFVNPPAGTFDQSLDFWVYVDGGRPPYTLMIDFGDGTPILTRTDVTDQLAFFTHSYLGPIAGTYNAKIEVIDDSGAYVGGVSTGHGAVADGTNNYDEEVAVGDRIPLNISLMATPVSGVDAFPVQVHYAVGGGVKGAGFFGDAAGGYVVGLVLLNDDGVLVDSWNGTGANTFGADGLPDTSTIASRPPIIHPPGLSGDPLTSFANADRPITLFVPGSGKYYLQAVVLDGDFELAFNQVVIYSEGYVAPAVYDGLGTPRVRYTLEPEDPTDGGSDLVEKPLHAVRLWVDPLYDPYAGTYPDSHSNDVRLLETDLQILGELFTVDPNPNIFFSSDFSPVEDPLEAHKYDISIVTDPSSYQDEDLQDFYDTYTFGRININTAPEEVLAAVFMNIVVERAYYYTDNPADSDYWKNGQRNYAADVMISYSEARSLARAVVDYRNSYYDAQMPAVPGYGNFDLGTDNIRVSHLPVIGPWDGANPHEYENDDRDADLPTFDDGDVDNMYDNYSGNYYNLDDGAYKFYAPSDIAYVREQFTGETDEDYAKYLNYVMDNSGSDTDLGFDARYYFTYNENTETIEGARNRMAVIRNSDSEGNEHVAFSFIPNPPFQSAYDLWKVVGSAEDFVLLDPDPQDFSIDPNTGRPDYDESSMDTIGDDDIGNVRTFSGPSVFRYVERWVPGDGTEHSVKGRYEVVMNYLADIEPYITTRSYVFRIEGKGVIPTSGSGAGNAFQTGRTSRDRNVLAIVDVGPLGTSPEPGMLDFFGMDVSRRLTHKVIYRQDVRMDEGGF